MENILLEGFWFLLVILLFFILRSLHRIEIYLSDEA